MVTEISAFEASRAPRFGRAAGGMRSVRAVIRSSGRVGQVLRFAGHFVEMAIAMEVGMIALGPVLSLLPVADAVNHSPEASALAMTASMVLPMAGWMLIRKHGWGHAVEMTTAMSVPTLVLVAGSLAGLLPHSAAAVGMGVLMWAGMLGAMLFRWRDYTGRGHHAHQR